MLLFGLKSITDHIFGLDRRRLESAAIASQKQYDLKHPDHWRSWLYVGYQIGV